MNQTNDQELQSVFSVIWERKWLALSVAALVIAGGVAYTTFATPIWEARATLIFPVRLQSTLGNNGFDQSAPSSNGPTPLRVFGGMLNSESALNIVSKTTHTERRKVRDMRTIQEQVPENSITISARDTNADLAKNVVASHLDALKSINDTVSKPLNQNDVEVIKTQLVAQRKRLASDERALLNFQQKSTTAPTVEAAGSGKDLSLIPNAGRWGEMLRQLEVQYASLDSSIKDAQHRMNRIAKNRSDLPASLPPVEKWRTKLTDLQYDLQLKELALAPEAPEVVKLKKTIQITKAELKSELSKYALAANAGMVDASGDTSKLPNLLTQRVAIEAQIRAVKRLAEAAPAESIKLSQLTREVTTQSSILQQLQSQYQQATLQADRDANRWEVLDEPRVDDRAINKSYTKNGVLSAIAGCAFGALLAMIAPRRRRKAAVLEFQPDTKKAA